MKIKRQWRALEFFNPIFLSVLIFNFTVATAQESNLKTYIVYVKKPDQSTLNSQESDFSTLNSREGSISVSGESGFSTLSSSKIDPLDAYYESFLPQHATTLSSTSSNQHNPRMVHSYKNVASGFAARLTAEEAEEMAAKHGVVSAQPEKIFPLHTTHTPNFLGLREGLGLWRTSRLGQGVIIGVLDTGISPNHPSFHDDGVPPPPPKWKGKCQFSGGTCNKKLIGARNFVIDEDAKGPPESHPPFDDDGHGTHTAGTAAGNFVNGANVFGNGNGTAVGTAPYAHVAVYRVCNSGGCRGADILAGLDAAVDDGVDVLSLSIGGVTKGFYEDPIAIGTFAAMQKGIFVSCSAGNNGSNHSTLSNEAPWILTVGATTIDRKFKATVKLGTGEQLEGETLYQPKNSSSTTMLPLVFAGANGSSPTCVQDTLQNNTVAGKVVACYRGGFSEEISKGVEVMRAGGVAMILMNEKENGDSVSALVHVLPTSEVSYAASLKIMSYINSTTTPTAMILFQGTVIGDSNAPQVAFFSSRGPSLASPGILKPDIVGPGVDILAAWPVPANDSTSKPKFGMLSGTSMSCPHLSGIAALLRSSHPDWSPAAIKSAVMTTAEDTNLGGKPILDEKGSSADYFAIGAGHVNPSKANNPGLIYDIKPEDYISYLCGLNYTDEQISVNCSQVISIPEAQLNYPSFAVILGSESQNYTRTVTNVGEANSIYNVEVGEPAGTKIGVNPSKITFTELNQKMNYTVTFSLVDRARTSGDDFSQGHLRWVSNKYSVKSQISVIFEENFKNRVSQ